MKRMLLTITAGLALSLSASADIVAQWNFNDNPSDGSASTGTLSPAVGSGIASAVGAITTVNFNAPGGSSDPLGSDPNNSGWRMVGFPAATSNNKTAGAQFAVDTTGYQDITMAWDQLNINSGSKYWRIQYSTDNGANWVDKDVIIQTASSTWVNPIATVSFAGVPEANKNPNFMVRIVSEFQSTATGTGTAGYVGVNATYNPTAANMRLDMVTFRGTVASDTLKILSQPASQVVAAAQPVSFSVSAVGGTTPITYQWRKNTNVLSGATNAVYNIAAAQTNDAGFYDVVVDNGVTNLISDVATLTVRVPAGLAWTGQSGTSWNTSDLNWLDTNSLVTVAYTGGDHVLFDIRGAAAPTVSLTGSLNPSSVTVDADSDYTFRTDAGGKLVGTTRLTKRGTGTLILDTDNTHSGPTVIEAGVVQLGMTDAHGALGSGPITNNGALVFSRTDIITLSNNITGSGSLTNYCTLTLKGVNTYGGPLAANAGSLILNGNQTINSPDIFVTASTATGPSGATKFALGSGGLVVGAGTTIHFAGLTAAPDCRATFQSLSGTNIINGPTILEGNGSGAFQTEGVGTLLTVNGDVSGPSFSGTLFLRGGNGSGILNGTINLPGCNVHKPDTSTWTINSTNNVWNFTSFVSGGIRLGAHNALPTGLTLFIGVAGSTATLDLAGFNQQLANLSDTGGTEIITNSSPTAHSTLTVGSGIFSGVMGNSATGGKIGLTVNGTTFTLAASQPYRGNTTVSAGTLALSGAGDFPNSPVIDLAGGGLDVSTRNDATLNISATQTLKGNGTLAVSGNLVNNGIIELKTDKADGIVSNDKVAVTGALTLGGTLKLLLSGQTLTSADTISVVSAGGIMDGGFTAIQPAVPAPGLIWDTNTLASDGILRIAGSGAPMIATASLSSSGNAIIFGGTGGFANGTFNVVTSTNVAAALSTWTTIQTGSFDGDGNFSVTNAIVPGTPTRFFGLQVP